MSIASEIERLQTAKADLKTAIEAKGIEVADTDTIDTYASKVEAIESGGVEHSDYINPEWTSWRYFSVNDNRNSLVSKLRYSDTANGTAFNSMFYDSVNLTYIPDIDTSNALSMAGMFRGCCSLTSIPKLNTSKCKEFDTMLMSCATLTSIPEMDTSNGIKFNSMFAGCTALTSISKLNVSKSGNFNSTFNNCTSLTDISFDGVIPVSISFLHSPLTLESAISVITHLANYAGTTDEFKYTVTFSTTTWGYLDAEGETASPNGNSWRQYINDLGWNAS